jgi:hypothetical protein
VQFSACAKSWAFSVTNTRPCSAAIAASTPSGRLCAPKLDLRVAVTPRTRRIPPPALPGSSAARHSSLPQPPARPPVRQGRTTGPRVGTWPAPGSTAEHRARRRHRNGCAMRPVGTTGARGWRLTHIPRLGTASCGGPRLPSKRENCTPLRSTADRCRRNHPADSAEGRDHRPGPRARPRNDDARPIRVQPATARAAPVPTIKTDWSVCIIQNLRRSVRIPTSEGGVLALILAAAAAGRLARPGPLADCPTAVPARR